MTHDSRTFPVISSHSNREIDDLGIYNGEYVTIENSMFDNVDKALASIYRGGTDESTFGPHVLIQNNELNNVGKGKRNKLRSSIHLLGVQVATVRNNRLSNSAPIRVVETVGDPITRVSDNEFVDTREPVIGPIGAFEIP